MLTLKDIEHGELFVVYGVPLYRMEQVTDTEDRCQCMDEHSQQLHEDTNVDKLITWMEKYYLLKTW